MNITQYAVTELVPLTPITAVGLTLFTAGGQPNAITYITMIVVANISLAQRSVTWYVVPAGGTLVNANKRWRSAVLPSSTTWEPQYGNTFPVKAGTFFYFQADVDNLVNVAVYGALQT